MFVLTFNEYIEYTVQQFITENARYVRKSNLLPLQWNPSGM